MKDQEKSATNAEQSKNTHAEANSPVILHQTSNSPPNDKPAAKEQSECGHHKKTILPLRLWRILRRKRLGVPRANFAEKSTVFITLVIAFIGGIQAYIYSQQKKIMESSGGQTDKLISAANTQADAATKISKAADKFSQSADDMKTQMTTAVGDFEKAASDSAKTSQKLVANAEAASKFTQQSFLHDQRAWIGMAEFHAVQFEENKPIQVDLDFFNSGKTPALKMHEIVKYKLWPIPLDGPFTEDVSSIEQVLPSSPINASPPQGRFISHLRDNESEELKRQYPSIKNKSLFLHIYGEIEYQDIGGERHTTQFCIFLNDPDTKELFYCKSFNEMN